MPPRESCLLQGYWKTLFCCRSPCTDCLKSLCREFKGQTKPKAMVMTVIVRRLSYWNGLSHAFTHKLAVSTWIFKNCSYSWVIPLLPGRKGLWGVISTYASVYKTHTLLTMPSRQETSGWKWKIRQRAAAPGAVQDASLPCLSYIVETGIRTLLCEWLTYLPVTPTSSGSHLWSGLVSCTCSVLGCLGRGANGHHWQKILRTDHISCLKGVE